MLFLAVFFSFVAENIRESQRNNEEIKKNIQSMKNEKRGCPLRQPLIDLYNQ